MKNMTRCLTQFEHLECRRMKDEKGTRHLNLQVTGACLITSPLSNARIERHVMISSHGSD